VGSFLPNAAHERNCKRNDIRNFSRSSGHSERVPRIICQLSCVHGWDVPGLRTVPRTHGRQDLMQLTNENRRHSERSSSFVKCSTSKATTPPHFSRSHQDGHFLCLCVLNPRATNALPHLLSLARRSLPQLLWMAQGNVPSESTHLSIVVL
jgi:hypothetical protein